MTWKTLDYTGWGRALRASGQCARPERRRALEALMATEPGPALGQRRSYGDVCLNDGGRAVDMTRLDKILDFNAETGALRVDAGLRLSEIVRLMAPRGWLPPVLPGTGFATVGGAIANDVHGKNHHKAGSFAQHVPSLTLITPSSSADGGGVHEITPDMPLFRASAGGLGQTGIIAEAVLMLKPVKADIVTVTERRAEGFERFLALLDGSEATYCVGWIDATATGAELGRGIIEEAETAAGLVPAPKPSKSVPIDAPGFALAPTIVRGFNTLYYRRVPAAGRTVVKPLRDFFFPLDRIHDWNRLYGKAGFHQFQCVVPLEAREALREMLRQIARAGLASPLAVLKRMGPGRAGHLSFPMDGYTLAVDLRARPEALKLIARLDEMTAEAGGRIYFAKDALASAERVSAMYPELDDWRALCDSVDPERRLVTDLVRRLNLRPAS